MYVYISERGGVEPPRTAYMLPWARVAGGQAVSRTSFPFPFPSFPFPSFPAGGSLAGRKNTNEKDRYVAQMNRYVGNICVVKIGFGRKENQMNRIAT